MSFSVFTKFKAVDGVTPAFKSMIVQGNNFQRQAGRIQNVFARAFRSIGSGLRSLKNGFNSVTDKIFTVKNAIMAVVAGQVMQKIASLGKAWIDFASDLTETKGKVDVVFGSMSKQVDRWAKSSIKSMGLAQQTALDSAALFGDMGTGMGMSQKRAAEMAMSLTQLGADMASFKNITNDIATTALKSVYTGETESLKNLGVVMTQANLEEFARSKGLRKKIKDMKEAEKVELRYLYVMDRTKNAQGDFLRTGGNAANQMRMHSEMLKEIQTNWGMIILPEYTKLLTEANQMLVDNMPVIQKSFEDFYGVLKRCYHILVDFYKTTVNVYNSIVKFVSEYIGVLAFVATLVTLMKTYYAVAAAVEFFRYQQYLANVAMLNGQAITPLMLLAQGKLIGAFKLLAATTWASVKAIWAQTTALLANPFVAVAVAIAGLVALIVTLIRYWDELTWRFKQKFENPLKDLTPEQQKKLDAYNKKNGTNISTKLPGYASGTDYFPGGLALVGERGPEIVRLPSATKIYNNNRTMRMIEQMSQPRKNNVIDFEKYLNKRSEIEIPRYKEANGGVLEIELTAPEGYDAKVVNAKTPDGREFKVKLRGKRKQ